jgi:hypothetical protein
MNSLTKIIHFLSSKYYNNLKYNNSILYSLRLFFERTLKFNHTITSLGNVYRNSKWSNLKIQNIKNSFLTQFFSVFLLTALVIIFLILSIKMGYLETQLLKVLPYKLWYTIQDFCSYLFLLLLSLIYSLWLKVNNIFYYN